MSEQQEPPEVSKKLSPLRKVWLFITLPTYWEKYVAFMLCVGLMGFLFRIVHVAKWQCAVIGACALYPVSYAITFYNIYFIGGESLQKVLLQEDEIRRTREALRKERLTWEKPKSILLRVAYLIFMSIALTFLLHPKSSKVLEAVTELYKEANQDNPNSKN